jgi:hypothetical protein
MIDTLVGATVSTAMAIFSIASQSRDDVFHR